MDEEITTGRTLRDAKWIYLFHVILSQILLLQNSLLSLLLCIQCIRYIIENDLVIEYFLKL